jgi:DNA-binding MarR family transcriptional regulator
MCRDDGFATGWEVIIAVRRFQHRLEVFMDQSLEPLGLSFAQYRALELLASSNEMHISELARSLRVSRQGALTTVRKLDRGGLIDTAREAGRVYVKPSSLGRHRLHLCRKFTADFKQHIERDLTHGERYRITRLLSKADRSLPSPNRPEWWLAP